MLPASTIAVHRSSTSRTDERFRAQDRDDLAGLACGETNALGFDLRDAVWTDTVHRIGLEERMMIGNAVDRGGGDMNNARTACESRGVEHGLGAGDIDRMDLLGRIERESGSRVDDDIAAARRAHDIVEDADVAPHGGDARLLGVVERLAVE
jgi:hypothetical protein